MLTTCDVSLTGEQVQLLTVFIHALRLSRDQGWVSSGSFDRAIKLWDLSRASQAATAPPLMTFTLPESSGTKASIYALAVDPQGHTIVSGGPERVIRMWDPRASKRIGKFVGHTDNIRAVLVSRCVRCSISLPSLRPHFLHKQLLTASADDMSASHVKAKISLMTGQRRSSSGLSPRSAACIHLHTIPTLSGRSTHHIRLEIFYSGDKSGFVSKTDVEGCAQISEGECALICQDVAPPAEGVIKLVALDDTLVWTASESSSLRRWRAPPRRAVRATAPIVEPLGLCSIAHIVAHPLVT